MVKRDALRKSALRGLTLFSLSALSFASQAVFATATCNTVNGTTTCADSTTFNVKVTEVLTVSITNPQTWASGASGSFLTNKVGISVISNNPAGFTATMTTSSANPSLINTTDNTQTISTISDSNGINLANSSTSLWGYGIVETNATAPTTYYGMVGLGAATPIQIMRTTTASSIMSKDLYFGAKGSTGTASGTYESGVLISVVSGVIDSSSNPTTPVNPVAPSDDTTPNNNTPTYIAPTTPPKGNSSTGVTVATNTSSTSSTSTTTTEIMEGNATSDYVAPAGVTNRTATVVGEGTPLATGLAVTAGIAAVAGVGFFVVAKHQNDSENDKDF